VSRKLTKKLAFPYSNCEFEIDKPTLSFNSELFKWFGDNNETYSLKSCVELCYQRLIERNCRCYDSRSTPYNKSEVCYSDQELKCIHQAYANMAQANSTVNDQCYALCPIECDSSEFSTSVSISKYPPSSRYTELLKGNPKIQKIHPGITELELNWESVLKVIFLYLDPHFSCSANLFFFIKI
jgi:hypothetical protein